MDNGRSLLTVFRLPRMGIKKSLSSPWITIALLLGIAMLFRLYRLPETILFNSDQGLDMITVWNMDHYGHLPVVGPFLSLPSYFTPPTYYYLTWFLYHVTV